MKDFDASHALGNLLARIHGDGGHYIDKHGWHKACADGEKRVVEKFHAHYEISYVFTEMTRMLKEGRPHAAFAVALSLDFKYIDEQAANAAERNK